jgi:hypothetical protein
MRRPSVPELLAAWERGLEMGPVSRALELLAVAFPDTPREELASFTIGNRDGLLLELRELLFGPDMAGFATCSGCGETLDVTIKASDVRVNPPDDGDSRLELREAGYDLQLRLPNSHDLIAASGAAPAQRRQVLLKRCLVRARCDTDDVTADELPAEVLDAVVKHLAAADPQADIHLTISCPKCGHRWQAQFDVLSFFCTELEAWVRRLLREVHALASAYGWNERDILALSATRRTLYLEMVGT